MARKRVPLLLEDGPPRARKAPPPPPAAPPSRPGKPAGKAPVHPAQGRKAPPPPKVAAPAAKAPKARQEKMDLKAAVKALAEPNPVIKDKPYVDVNGTPPPPGTRGAKGPVPPVPDLKPKPPREGTALHLFEAAQPGLPPRRWEIQYTGRVHVTHDPRDGTVVIEEYRPSYPELKDPEPARQRVMETTFEKIYKKPTGQERQKAAKAEITKAHNKLAKIKKGAKK